MVGPSAVALWWIASGVLSYSISGNNGVVCNAVTFRGAPTPMTRKYLAQSTAIWRAERLVARPACHMSYRLVTLPRTLGEPKVNTDKSWQTLSEPRH